MILDSARIAASLSAGSTRTGATWNAVRIAAGRRWDVSGSTATTRGVNRGPGDGPARRIANALGTSSVAIRSFPISIACSAIVYGTGSGNDGRSGLPGARGRRCTDGQLHRDLEGAHHKYRSPRRHRRRVQPVWVLLRSGG